MYVRWDRYPAGQRSIYKGKEGCLTLLYGVTVDHNNLIIAATEGYPGARNDKTLLKFDGFLNQIHQGKLYGHVLYELCTRDGTLTQEKDCYLFFDGGYHNGNACNVRLGICPSPPSRSRASESHGR